MDFPLLGRKDILDAIIYIEKKGVPRRYDVGRYDVVTDSGQRYPANYVVALAEHFVNDEEIAPDRYYAPDVKRFLLEIGFTVEDKRAKWVLTITSQDIQSTDPFFDLSDLRPNDLYRPLDVYFQAADGTITRRSYLRGEEKNAPQTLPRLACQVFENQLSGLSPRKRANFPICKTEGEGHVGLYGSVREYRAQQLSGVHDLRL